MIQGSRIRVITDHKALKYVLHQKQVSPKLAKWLDKLADYNIDIEFTKGDRNQVADALSRPPDPTQSSGSEYHIEGALGH